MQEKPESERTVEDIQMVELMMPDGEKKQAYNMKDAAVYLNHRLGKISPRSILDALKRQGVKRYKIKLLADRFVLVEDLERLLVAEEVEE